MEEKKPVMDLDTFIKKAVQQSREIKAKKKGLIKKVSGETQKLLNETEEALLRFRLAQKDLNWEDHAVVLMVNRIQCKVCGNTYLSPNGHIFVRRENRLVGVHYKAIDHELEKYRHLPRVTEYRQDSAPHCMSCFQKPLSQGMNYQERQLALFDRVTMDF